MRQALPVLVGLAVVLMVAGGLGLSLLGWPQAGGLVVIAIGIAFAFLITENDSLTKAWQRGAEGERRTGAALAELESAGFISLHDRQMPVERGNLDHIAIGPTGIFVIETKHMRGKVETDRDTL